MPKDWEEKDTKETPEKTDETGLTRRDWFGFAGAALAATALPLRFPVAAPSAEAAAEIAPGIAPGTAPAAAGVSPVMEKLSAYMSEASSRPLPGNVAQTTKEHILDTLGAMISGSKLLPGRRAIQFAQAYGGKPVSTVMATNMAIGPIEAALTNAMMAHADETDDSHSASSCHPGCGIIPPALAIGEQFGVSGTRLIRAVALGYDVGTRVTLTLGGGAFEAESHWSTHTIAPLFGAAAACGSLAGFDAHQMRLSLGYTAQQSSGLGAWDRDTQHIQKAFAFGGMAARGGVLSTLVIHDGWTGVEDIFSGADSFFDAYNPHANPEGLIDKLGEFYQITRSDIKKWPVASTIQAALDAIVLLRKKHPFTADQVRHATVQLPTSLAVIVNNRKMPDICVQQMVAVMLMDAAVTFHSANDVARMKDSATLRQRAKVTLVPSEELQRLIPVRAAIVEITLTDGTRLTERVNHVRGSFMNPMSSEEVAAKARDLITAVLGAAKTSALIDTIYNLEKVNDIRELRPLLQKA
ncbi:MAG TPA: MmgE/PrpD family protein [Candidatus Dormibacteraeota bacterium]|nr:MmgE/PrpD family protein [Candidatus Dormibacteraeota bacterium]